MLVPHFRPWYSGAGIQAERLALTLVPQGVRVTMLAAAPEGGRAPAHEERGAYSVRRFRTPAGDLGRKLVLGLRSAFWLLTHSGWDLLHIHGFSYYAILPVLVARVRGRPVLVKTTLLGFDDPDRKNRHLAGRISLAVFRSCDAIVALSADLEQRFRQDGLFRGEILRIPNGVDHERFRPASQQERAAARVAFHLPANAFIIASAGRLDRRKNVSGIVEVAGCMRQRPVCVVLAGPPAEDASERRELEEAIARLPEGVEVRLPGELEPHEMAELLRAADLFALASSTEGLPNSLLEGMASGLACLATDIPGTRDVLSQGGGVLVPASDLEAFARALDSLASNAEERTRLGERARAVIEERYLLTSVAERYRATYDALLDAR